MESQAEPGPSSAPSGDGSQATKARLASANGSTSGLSLRTSAPHQQLPPRPKLALDFPSSAAISHADFPRALAGLPIDDEAESTTSSHRWISIVSAPAHAPLQSWLRVMNRLIRHPERSSSNILRADVLGDQPELALSTDGASHVQGQSWKRVHSVRRRILPRRPNLDWPMEQDCSLYIRSAKSQHLSPCYNGAKSDDHQDTTSTDDQDGFRLPLDASDVEEAVVVYTPLIGVLEHPKMDVGATEETAKLNGIGTSPPSEAFIPFYHPKVRALAFHYRPQVSVCPTSPAAGSAPADSNDRVEITVRGTLSISTIPFDPRPDAFGPTHKLARIGQSLLTTIHMHTWGDLHSYQKRVHHDRVVPRERFQDLYLLLKSRYTSQLIAGWAESTDPAKHVFEDLGIAAFLIALWENLYREPSNHTKDGELEGGQDEKHQTWRRKVKFVDVGCGNGLLVHILAREGFKGVGLDLRQRKSWAAYATHADLREWTFTPASLASPDSLSHDYQDASLWTGAFLIGNHADELTPWIPVLATYWDAAGFINIPCCYYALEGGKNFPLLLKSNDGKEVSRNEQYLHYVADLTNRFGWNVELEALRIPSTKNWCFVGRARSRTSSDASSADSDALKELVNQTLGDVGPSWTARVGV
ncbi:DUF1613-domain-containing protein [Testicularia cyperi]|uniref:tRNA (uracil-O(2)-)-methyltransferase n=1 Tax=Testicularia cyperi TaxID=1882483 RepID=A0A317XJU2_9BASI|nr:DUF1613-domain-containing protein [Testicularia cyperi]